MDSSRPLSRQQQKQSIVDAYNHPEAANASLDESLARLKAAISGGASAPVAPAAEPMLSPADVQYQNETGDAHIAAQQAANLAQAQRDPEMAARLAATQAAVQRFRDQQEGRQLDALSQIEMKKKKAGPERYPANE